jgi:hypothetical protein
MNNHTVAGDTTPEHSLHGASLSGSSRYSHKIKYSNTVYTNLFIVQLYHYQVLLTIVDLLLVVYCMDERCACAAHGRNLKIAIWNCKILIVQYPTVVSVCCCLALRSVLVHGADCRVHIRTSGRGARAGPALALACEPRMIHNGLRPTMMSRRSPPRILGRAACTAPLMRRAWRWAADAFL